MCVHRNYGYSYKGEFPFRERSTGCICTGEDEKTGYGYGMKEGRVEEKRGEGINLNGVCRDN